mmetsp:Transcript_30165/g.82919  ORF Transcript_30165/g.82919 Transcript_30165/m.82919 type:complete len:369 (-) Transcript_30165:97-1203(-)|eukprot:CAMPEP_0117503384 /NCGR_PEP_ID=MMETSP0784-20121206/24303_1 /TAXON_ID=39447 /ORGANISM="" /LENGTH=368 /DNA_ID=CAMNT_0005298701 /DNA_START=68 /DNA_END=1174 /DNA_ORIENTATION=+
MAGQAFDPMAQKVVRLTKSNEKLQQDIFAKQREATGLREERQSMAFMFQEQLAELARNIAEDAARSNAAELLCRPVGPDSVDEIAQLEDELHQNRQVAARRHEQRAAEVASLRTRIEQCRQKFRRTCGVSRAMSESAEADFTEASELDVRARQLGYDVEELEASCSKLHSQVDAWRVRHREVQHHLASAEEASAKRELELREGLAAARAAVECRLAELTKANNLCTTLKSELSDGVWPATVAQTSPSTPSDATAVGAASGSAATGGSSQSESPAGDSRAGKIWRCAVGELREKGVQTQYISEQARLRQEVERLKVEVERVGRGLAGTGGAPAGVVATRGAAGVVGNWLSFCLRPQYEEVAPRAQQLAI